MMSWTFMFCAMFSFAWMGLFYLWGKSFLTLIHAERDVGSSIVFGYLCLQILYQIIYLPFYVSRGSYRIVSYSWIGVTAIISVLMTFYLHKHPLKKRNRLRLKEVCGICAAVMLVLSLAIYIALHVPFYGQDTRVYISAMNDSYYSDSMWVKTGAISFDHGMCSLFQFFTMTSLLSGIKPYYVSLFTVRILGICMFSLVLYRMGVIVFKKKEGVISWPALFLVMLVPTCLMFWGSNYTAEFFYWRINEAKGYCQFVLLPLSFSVFLAMFQNNTERKKLWEEQLLVGLAAIPVSASSLTSYLFLLFMGTIALLAFDKLKKGWETVGWAVLCALPNLLYLAVYILEKYERIAL